MDNVLTEEIFNEIKNKLSDPVFTNKYGTSVTFNMGREYQKHLEEKYAKLKKEFDKINKNPNNGIDKLELLEFFKNYQQKNTINFSEDYVDKLFNLIDLDKNNEITMYYYFIKLVKNL